MRFTYGIGHPGSHHCRPISQIIRSLLYCVHLVVYIYSNVLKHLHISYLFTSKKSMHILVCHLWWAGLIELKVKSTILPMKKYMPTVFQSKLINTYNCKIYKITMSEIYLFLDILLYCQTYCCILLYWVARSKLTHILRPCDSLL